MRFIVTACVCVAAAAGCHAAAREEQQGPQEYTLLKAITPHGTALGPGDVFEVKVFQEPDLSNVYRVAADGSIKFPLCGRLQVGGKTGAELEEFISTCLKAGNYLKSPQVSVYVKELNSKKVFVFGEVQKAGTFAYEDSMTIVQAITLAGGFTAKAAPNSTSVTRIVDGQDKRVKVPVKDIGNGNAPNFLLAPGDIVYVPESFF